jgi:hypothetical protein
MQVFYDGDFGGELQVNSQDKKEEGKRAQEQKEKNQKFSFDFSIYKNI